MRGKFSKIFLIVIFIFISYLIILLSCRDVKGDDCDASEYDDKISRLEQEIEELEEILKDLFETESQFDSWWSEFRDVSGDWTSFDGAEGKVNIDGRLITFSECDTWKDLNGKSFLLSDSLDFYCDGFYYIIDYRSKSGNRINFFRHKYKTNYEDKGYMFLRRFVE